MTDAVFYIYIGILFLLGCGVLIYRFKKSPPFIENTWDKFDEETKKCFAKLKALREKEWKICDKYKELRQREMENETNEWTETKPTKTGKYVARWKCGTGRPEFVITVREFGHGFLVTTEPPYHTKYSMGEIYDDELEWRLIGNEEDLSHETIEALNCHPDLKLEHNKLMALLKRSYLSGF